MGVRMICIRAPRILRGVFRLFATGKGQQRR